MRGQDITKVRKPAWANMQDPIRRRQQIAMTKLNFAFKDMEQPNASWIECRLDEHGNETELVIN